MVSDPKKQGKWKIQLSMAINVMCFKDSNKTCSMHSKSHNIEIMIGNETNEITEKLFNSLLPKYLKCLEESMKSSTFVFDSIIYCITNVIK